MSRPRVGAIAAVLVLALLVQPASPGALSDPAEAARLFGRGGLLAKIARIVIAIKFPGAMVGIRTVEQIVDRRDFYRRLDRWLREKRMAIQEREARLAELFDGNRIDVRTYNRRVDEIRRLGHDYEDAHDRLRAIRGEQFSRFVQQEILDQLMPRIIDSGSFNELVGGLGDGFTALDNHLMENICSMERLASSLYPRALRDLQTKIRELKRASDDSGLTEVIPEVRRSLNRIDGRLSALQRRVESIDPLGLKRQMALARQELGRVKGMIDTEVARLQRDKTIVIPARAMESDPRVKELGKRIEASEADLTRSAIQEAMLRRATGRWIDDHLKGYGLDTGDSVYFDIRDAFVGRLARRTGRVAFTDEILESAWRGAVQDVVGEAPPEPDRLTAQEEAASDDLLTRVDELCGDEDESSADSDADRGVGEDHRPPPSGDVDAEALQRAMWDRCTPIHDRCVDVNCDSGYSGCISDCGGCFSMAPRTAYNEYWLEIEPGYQGCAEGAAGAYVGKVQGCVGTFQTDSRPGRVVIQNDCLRQAWETLVKAVDECQAASCRTWCGMQGLRMEAAKPSCSCAE